MLEKQKEFTQKISRIHQGIYQKFNRIPPKNQQESTKKSAGFHQKISRIPPKNQQESINNKQETQIECQQKFEVSVKLCLGNARAQNLYMNNESNKYSGFTVTNVRIGIMFWCNYCLVWIKGIGRQRTILSLVHKSLYSEVNLKLYCTHFLYCPARLSRLNSSKFILLIWTKWREMYHTHV